MSGFGIMLGIEDPRDRWGSDLGSTYTMPDIIAAITASQASLGWQAVGRLGAARSAGGVYGVAGSLTIKLDAIAPGDALRLRRLRHGHGVRRHAAALRSNGETMWTAFASFQHYFSPTVSAALTGTYASDSTAGSTAWGIGANLVWAPVTGFSANLQGTTRSSRAARRTVGSQGRGQARLVVA